MRQGHIAIRMVYVVAFLVVSMAGSAGLTAASQSSGTYVSQLTGAEIQLGGSWSYFDDLTEVGPDYEFVGLQDDSSIGALAFFPGNTNLEVARDAFLGGFATEQDITLIDRGSYGQVSYSLDIASIEGMEMGVFTLLQSSLIEGYAVLSVYIAPVSYFASGMSSAQNSITVNGTQLFDGIESSGLQDLLEQNEGVSGGSTEAPDGPDGDTTVEAEEPAPTEEPQSGDVSGDGAAYVATVQAELDSLYIGLGDFLATFTEVTEDGLSESELTAAVEQMHAIATSWQSYPSVAAGIVAPEGYEAIDASYQTLAGDIGVLGDSWYAFLADTGSDAAFDDVFTNLETVTDDLNELQGLLDEATELEVAAEEPVEDEPTEVATAEAVDGEEPGNDGTSRQIPDRNDDAEIEEEIENESETGRGGQEADLTDYEVLGLVSESEYVSPQHDVEIVWDDNWYFDDSTDNPISSDTSNAMDSVSITWTGEAYVVTYVDILESGGFMPEEYVEYWTSEEYLSASADPEAELLLEDSSEESGAVLYRDYLDDGKEISLLLEATCLDRSCDLISYTTMIGLPETFGDAYADAEDGIEIDGEFLLTSFSARQIERALD